MRGEESTKGLLHTEEISWIREIDFKLGEESISLPHLSINLFCHLLHCICHTILMRSLQCNFRLSFNHLFNYLDWLQWVKYMLYNCHNSAAIVIFFSFCYYYDCFILTGNAIIGNRIQLTLIVNSSCGIPVEHQSACCLFICCLAAWVCGLGLVIMCL